MPQHDSFINLHDGVISQQDSVLSKYSSVIFQHDNVVWDRWVTMGLFAQPVLKAYKQYQVNGELTLV